MTFLKHTILACLFALSLPCVGQEIHWMSWEEAAAANEQQPKKIFVDVYTHWCGWCKRMDQTTFKDSSVVQYMNEHFYAVKFDAEQTETVHWRDMDFKWTGGGRNGFNELALELLDRQMSFPSFVLLDKVYARIMISPGYKEPADLMLELKFAVDEAYRNSSWADYVSKSKS